MVCISSLVLASLAVSAKAQDAISDLDLLQSLTGKSFYQFINYNAIYGSGGVLCYKLTVGVSLLAVQNTCDLTCCNWVGAGGTDGFVNGIDQFANALVTNEQGEYPWHNYAADNGPGPYLVARLDQFATNDGSIGAPFGYTPPFVSTCTCDSFRQSTSPCPCGSEANRATNYGTGEWDIFPCPRTANLDPTQAGRTCNPAECFAAGGVTGGNYPGEVFGCEECDTNARVAYTFFEIVAESALELEVYHTVQRWESIATNSAVARTVTGSNYQACYYLANIRVPSGSFPPRPPMPPPPPPPLVSPPPPQIARTYPGFNPNDYCGRTFYQYIDYNSIYGEGSGTLCYRIEMCADMKAILNIGMLCPDSTAGGQACCTQGPVADSIFAAAVHNYQSDSSGPGPYLIANLDQYDPAWVHDDPNYNSECTGPGQCPPQHLVYGTGLHDIDPCPRTANLDPTNTRTCDPATCSASPVRPDTIWGCYKCNEVARVAYLFLRESPYPHDDGRARVYITIQRAETDSYAACSYVGEVFIHCPGGCNGGGGGANGGGGGAGGGGGGGDSGLVMARKDPHLHFAHGGRADLRGEDGAVFNFLSARNVSWNVKTEAANFKWSHRVVHGTRLSSVFWTIRTDNNHLLQIEYYAATADRAIVRNLNETRESVQLYTMRTSTSGNAYGTTYWLDNVHAKMDGNTLTVTVQDKWRMVVSQSTFPFAMLNQKKTLLDISAQALYDADHDIVAPHGLFGQSYDGDDIAVSGKVDKRSGDETITEAQAEGAIEGVYTDYKIDPSNPFSTAFKYSRFNALAAKPRDVSKLGGAKRPRSTPKSAEVKANDVPADAN